MKQSFYQLSGIGVKNELFKRKTQITYGRKQSSWESIWTTEEGWN